MKLRYIKLCSLLVVFVILLASCNNAEEESSGILRVGRSGLYDYESKMYVIDGNGINTLVDCEISDPYFVLPTEFVNGMKLNYVDAGSFNNRSELVELTIPDGYESISENAFDNCDNLKKVNIGKDVYMVWRVFGNCSNLIEFYVSDDNPYIYDLEGCVMSGDGSLCRSGGKMPLYGVKTIGPEAFSRIYVINEIIVPSTVREIRKSAFFESSLSGVTIPNSVTTIEEAAFGMCRELKEIYIPESVTSMGKNIFFGNTDMIINCEAESMPDSWDDGWLDNCSVRQINWGVKRDAVE